MGMAELMRMLAESRMQLSGGWVKGREVLSERERINLLWKCFGRRSD